jgi:hypothetical protein
VGMKRNINEIKDIHTGQDVYVLCSGASMNFIDKSFFDGKLCVSVNRVYKFFPCQYTVLKHYEDVMPAIQLGVTTIASKHDCGNLGSRENLFDGDYYVFNHLANEESRIDLSPLTDTTKDGYLVVSWSTVTSAIHFAYYIGAKNIIVCGHDCGRVDNEVNLKGYNFQDDTIFLDMSRMNTKPFMEYLEKMRVQNELVNNFEPQTLRLIEKIRSKGVKVVSLNPFINFGLEGHCYERISFNNNPEQKS